MKKNYLFFLNLIIFTALQSCNNDSYEPKPRSYFRINLPEKKYQTFDTIFPYSFDYPVYAKVILSNKENAGKYWMNINFPNYNATIHITYKNVKNNIDSLTENTRKFVDKHISKATSIKEKSYENPNNKVFSIVYDIKGNEVASPYQFYATDLKKHFIRGALYFNQQPNNDSLAPVIEFIEKDIDHMISTLKWKK